jgi:hypothetical protein
MSHWSSEATVRVTNISTLLALCWVVACGDSPLGPGATQPGYVLSVTLPGIADTTFEGDSLYWRILSGPNPAGGPDLRDLTLELIVLNPPPPLLSPLEFKVRWSQLQTVLPSVQSYALGLNPPADVVFQVSSNVGVWAASQGQLTLTGVSDASLRGGLTPRSYRYIQPARPYPPLPCTSYFGRHTLSICPRECRS